MLTDQELEHIAKLARLEIKPEERGKLKKDLSSVLDYVDKLNQADTSSVEPLYQTTGLVNSERKDEQREPFAKIEERLIKQAPQQHGRFVKVKSILNKK